MGPEHDGGNRQAATEYVYLRAEQGQAMRELTKGEITVTDAAKAYFTGLLHERPGMRLQIVSGKGCGGHEYDLKPLDTLDDASPDLSLALLEDKKLVVAAADFLKLFGSRIDYITDNLGNSRVEIVNPNETGRCGCGMSAVF